MSFENDIQKVLPIAKEAGRIIMSYYQTDVRVDYKERQDPVTQADREANEYLVTQLKHLFPGDGIVAEETEDKSDALKGGRCWYVDPLDGTKEFIAKNGEFAVMLGLAVEGASKLGVLYLPAKQKLYYGAEGFGAFLEDQNGKRNIQASDVNDTSKLKLVVSRSHRAPETDDIKKQLGITDENKSGSVGVKIGIIAEQKADLYFHFTDRSSLWDACGPEAILKAAGGSFTDLFGDDFVYGGSDMSTRRGILACNKPCFEKVVPIARAAAAKLGM